MPPAGSLLLLCLLGLLLPLPWPVTPEDPGKPFTRPPVRVAKQGPSWSLGLRLYRALRTGGTQNPLFSPVLLANSLAALGGGAGGGTAAQIFEVLGTGTPPPLSQEEALFSLYGGNGSSFRLHSASAVFTGLPAILDASFLKEAQTRSRLGHAALHWTEGQPDHEELHAWARAGAGGSEELQAKEAALILTDALRFKSLWDWHFECDEEDLRSFLGTTYTKVPMMRRAGVFHHYEDMTNMVQVLELGFRGGRASLVLLLPFHVENLSRLEKKQLTALGLTEAWDERKADFTRAAGQVLGQRRPHLGAVLHWASLELGSEAGSGDGEVQDGEVQDGEVQDEDVTQPKLFCADHPFIVMVKDNATGALLLMGALDHVGGAAVHDEL
ncbi:LOW QUALITY PROTEIN: serine (or cysteine) peptidase inhibitor, clade H, member 2 [Brienomyrus brachyistius]|uniref:LOW QUALITY PROTEIN: serine (or cysteine) peptidase inhibitor, clade H, member 2 n=1 Tax=Brienomyrus brachyistius TaxID=42636 RepID=UPI0020B1CA66|nr:LOW QUALITY PROTEIN: serine (or cysteine) peptidase inhibitor, clade H, member 2 [Brienomyrus brachyistius]